MTTTRKIGLGEADDFVSSSRHPGRQTSDVASRGVAPTVRSRPAYKAAKRLLDVVGSAALLASTAPVQAAVALAIAATMGRPVLFRQRRPGLHGKLFELSKFRTMREPTAHEKRLQSDDARLAPLGRFLRAASLDELPTLWSVLRGDMSLVGPRPLLVEYLPRYSARQARRHEVKPGVTGWAQVNGRNALSWPRKLELDVWYVDHQSFWLDLRILAMTAQKVLRREGVSHDASATMPEFMGATTQTSRAGSIEAGTAVGVAAP